jgi:transposase
VYVDESGVNTYLPREYARAPRGETVEDLTSGNHFERAHVVGALCAGVYCAIECYRQTTNSAFFERWFTGCLLMEILRRHTVIMDNAPFHRKKRLRKQVRGKVRLLFLPPYAPNYNPIEQSRANMKRFLHK